MVKVRPHRSGGWEVDIKFRLPSGQRLRERCKAPVLSKTGAQRWAEERERHLLQHGLPQPRKEVPTLKEFAPRFLDGHARANQQKPGGINHKETILRVHLIPHLGNRRLDAITNEDVQRVKYALRPRRPKTINNVLTVLSTLLKKAVEWNVIDRMPCMVRLLKASGGAINFYDFDEFNRLVDAAKATDPRAYLAVLLGGEAGLRAGEMRALQWSSVNFDTHQLCVQESEWRGHITTPKGGRLRYVPLTNRLETVLRTARNLRPLVLCGTDGRPLTENELRGLVQRAAQRAGLPCTGPHMLRHSFCTMLAMKGAPVTSIQSYAGHADLATTQRYMHESGAMFDKAIRLLDTPGILTERGAILDPADQLIAKSNV